MSVWDTIDTDAIRVIQKIYDRYNIPRIINARNLDFHWRKDGVEGDEQADAIKDLLRYLPGLLRIAAAHPDPAYTIPPVAVPDDASCDVRPATAPVAREDGGASATITANIANAARVAHQIGQELEERHRSARRGSVREFSTLDMDFDELMADVGRLARAVAMLADVVASQEERIAL